VNFWHRQRAWTMATRPASRPPRLRVDSLQIRHDRVCEPYGRPEASRSASISIVATSSCTIADCSAAPAAGRRWPMFHPRAPARLHLTGYVPLYCFTPARLPECLNGAGTSNPEPAHGAWEDRPTLLSFAYLAFGRCFAAARPRPSGWVRQGRGARAAAAPPSSRVLSLANPFAAERATRGRVCLSGGIEAE
jgi:hypothetical protein